MRTLVDWFKRLFNREKKAEYTPWGEEIKQEPQKSNPHSFKYWFITNLKSVRTRLFQPPKTKIHIKWLLKTKRVLSGFLCFIYLIGAISSIPNPISLVFFFTSFIFLDYLWKTRRVSWAKKDD